ncbi:MAG: transglycosylase domain-containing protein, partial [Novosphingobium sp.]
MADTNLPEEPQSPQHYRIRRTAGGVLAALRGCEGPLGDLRDRLASNWRDKRWFRLAGYALAALLAVWLVVWLLVARNLPSADKLLDYQPPLPTMVRAIDGEVAYSYARERRVQLRFVDFPEQLINAFLSAEDKTFWSHGGVDLTGLAGAVVDYASKLGSGQRAKGGSTITQQVAKNIL